MSSTGEGTIEIPIEEWNKFVLGFAPEGMKTQCVALDVPVVRGEWVSVRFAWGTEDHPSGWADAPEWLAPPVPHREG